MSIGIGLCINNARAVIEALFGKQTASSRARRSTASSATRTTGRARSTARSSWPSRSSSCALGLYFTATVFYALANGIYGTLPFLVLFQVGFLYTGLLSIVQQFGGDDMALQHAGGGADEAQGRARRRRRRRRRRSAISTATAASWPTAASTSTICAQHATFEEVCYLLWHGRLPTRAELGDLQTQLAAARVAARADPPAMHRCRRPTAWTRCGR